MSRDSNGVYTLAAGNPVVVNDLIEAGWANATLDDLAVAMQDSLSRSGKGGMSAALKVFAGTLAAPGGTWADEVATGWHRAGAGDIRFGLAGVELLKFTANAATLAGAFNGKNGADIASATGAGTLNLTTATGNTVDVTGTTTQTAITLAAGAQRLVRFTGILILTHGASLILPGAANITTAAGDYAIFQGYAAGVVRCVSYLRASGMAKAGANNDITSLAAVVSGSVFRKSAIINGGFTVNQRGYASAATLASGAFGHDRWKGGASGGDYSFTQLDSNTTITIAANKSLIQVVENKNVAGGDYVISWTGTATGRVGKDTATPAGNFAVSPITITGQAAGTTCSIELTGANAAGGSTIATNAGTVGKVQGEIGSVVTEFEYRMFQRELALCRRYYQKSFPAATAPAQNAGTDGAVAVISVSPSVRVIINIVFPELMRAAPTMIYFNPGAANAQARDLTAGADCSSTANFLVSDSGVSISAVGNAGSTQGNGLAVHYTASAEL